MKARTFAPTDKPGYEAAKFGRTLVTVNLDEPSTIYRGTPPAAVGHAGAGVWRYVVSGEGSGCATSQAAARAKGEAWALNSSANANAYPAAPRYALTGAEEAAEAEAFAAYLADITTRFPHDEKESAQ